MGEEERIPLFLWILTKGRSKPRRKLWFMPPISTNLPSSNSSETISQFLEWKGTTP